GKSSSLAGGEHDNPPREATAAVPHSSPQTPEGTKADRLALAKWLTDPSHPLTARVAVNRMWQTLFGTGIVKTAEDFGVQGEWPSHPELLDWLATEFVRRRWDVKALHRLIPTSATYRQSARATPEAPKPPPANRPGAPGPRLR